MLSDFSCSSQIGAPQVMNLRVAYFLPACSNLCEPSCSLARLLIYSFLSGFHGFANSIADCDSARPYWHLLLSIIQYAMAQQPARKKWWAGSRQPVCFLFQMLAYHDYISIKTLTESSCYFISQSSPLLISDLSWTQCGKSPMFLKSTVSSINDFLDNKRRLSSVIMSLFSTAMVYESSGKEIEENTY